MEPQPKQESVLLNQIFKIMRESLTDVFPEIEEIVLVYIFSKAESERTDCDGQCNRFENGIVIIGICQTLFDEIEKVKYVLMHEIAHLRSWDHTDVFYDALGTLIAAYNARTGENISFREEWKYR